jgi:hypothetical protein
LDFPNGILIPIHPSNEGQTFEGAKDLGEVVLRDSRTIVLPDTLDIMASDGERAIPLIAFPSAAEIQRWESRWSEFGRGLVHRWRWNNKLKSLPDERSGVFLAVAEGDNCHGMIILSWPFPSRRKEGTGVVYVEYLEVAPQNRPDAGDRRELRGVGTTLLQLALGPINKRLGLGGIGLHSLKSAEEFYQEFGMAPYGKDNGLTYFELYRRGEA